jgi:predicted nucleotidyltransferase
MPLLMPEALEEMLAEIVRRLREARSPSAIYVFGSCAYGAPGPGSDIDLLVVVEDGPLSPYQRDALAYKALRGIGMSIVVLVYTRREFEERAVLRVWLERTVKSRGRVLYAA